MPAGVYDRTKGGFIAGRRKASETLRQRGIRPSAEAIAGSLATRALGALGLTREDAPTLWKEYRDMYLDNLLTSR